MLGWRARLGLILNHPVIGLVPHEFYRIAPSGTVLLAVGLGLGGSKAFWGQPYEGVRDDYQQAVDALVADGADVIHLGGGDNLYTHGLDGLRRLLRDLSAGCPVRVKSTPTVLGPAVRATGATRIVVVGNYSPVGLENTIALLKENDLEVVGTGSGAAAGQGESPYPAYRAAKAALQANPSANGVLLVGGNWLPLQIIEEIEADLGVPVVTSVQAMVWSSLRWIGVNEQLAGAGSLLRSPGPATIPDTK